MRKFIVTATCLCVCFISQSQVAESEKRVALQLVEKNLIKAGLSSAELDQSIVAETYIVPGNDVRMLYLQQHYLNIPVYNQVHVMAFNRQGDLVSTAGTRIKQMDQRTGYSAPIPATSAVMAVAAALTECGLTTTKNIIPLAEDPGTKKISFGGLDVSTENITVELIWFPLENEEVKLCWQVFIAPRNSSDYWLMRFDARNSKLIHKESLTVYCNWNNKEHSLASHVKEHPKEKIITGKEEQVFAVNNAAYRVIPYPAESPIHPGGNPGLLLNPWTITPGNATSLGWHYDGTTYFNNTRGNNVYAYEDRNADNIAGLSPNSTTAQPDLSFDFVPNFTLEPVITSPAPNQQFNTTNLFYWNNMIHDLAYIYGFTESARNFQQNNQGHGGIGNDYVLAEAQDGSGTNNANFATPPDGSRPRMQMYLWTSPTPDRDGDVDNGIIIHEYTHGISNRMTGTGSGCLSNAEQMGEGWSDYFALMMTHDWANAQPGDGFTKPRGIGTYALNQPITGQGIRQYRYTTDMTVNPLTYSNLPTVVHPHGTGTIWCTVLWEMTWAIIQEAGINPSLHNIGGNGGNVIALKLVTEGLRLQPCSPGFISGRDAILKADTLYFGAQYSCAIINAFAKRGMGIGASQGSSNSRTDQVVSFSGCIPGSCQDPSGLNSSAISSTNATLSWASVIGATSYDMEYKETVSLTWITAAAGTTSTSVNLSGLIPSTLYDWRVRANCGSNSSGYTQSQFTTNVTPPPVTCPGIYDNSSNNTIAGAATIPLNTEIKGLVNPAGDKDHYKFSITTGGSVTLTLTGLPANYDLRLLNASGQKIAESKRSGTQNETINRTVTPGTYYALVLPKNNASHPTLCYTMQVNTGTASFGDGELIVKNSISLFPNPVNNRLVVSIPEFKGRAEIRVVDIVGRILIQKTGNEAISEIDLSALAGGVYLVHIHHDGKNEVMKIIKQ